MAYRHIPFAPGEWFHCYTRGVESRTVFEAAGDYRRFMESLYLCNSSAPARRDDLERKSPIDLFQYPRIETLVDVGAYCLMPNHFHLLLRATSDNGLTKFMQKLGTAYSMYFNIKNERVGGLFITPFRSKHVPGDSYFKRVTQYIHANPIELFEPAWKTGAARRRLAVIEKRLKRYPHSSLPDYLGVKRPERAILSDEAFKLIAAGLPRLSTLLEETALYYQEIS
jgi:hypothetical protein